MQHLPIKFSCQPIRREHTSTVHFLFSYSCMSIILTSERNRKMDLSIKLGPRLWFEISVLVLVRLQILLESTISTLYRPFLLIISAISVSSPSYRVALAISILGDISNLDQLMELLG